MMERLFRRCIHLNKPPVPPHKLILIYPEHKDRVSNALAKRLLKELSDLYLNVFETEKPLYSSQVPYTITITERTMVDGVLELRHHKPTISEEVHVSDIKSRLSGIF